MTLSLAPPLSMNGRLLIQSTEAVDLRQASVTLISTDPDLPSPQNVLPRMDGQFTFNGVLPGTYVLDISGLPQDLYLKDARLGEQHVLEEPMTIEKRLPATGLQVLLATDGGSLKVAVQDARGQSRPARKWCSSPRLGGAVGENNTVWPPPTKMARRYCGEFRREHTNYLHGKSWNRTRI